MTILEKKLGYSFKNIALLKEALTHRSYAYKKGIQSNERLEFLGDAVLELAIRSILFDEGKSLDEGKLSKFKAFLVKEATLAEIAHTFGISDFLRINKAEKETESILADTFEAIIGAIFLDSNFTTVKNLIKNWFLPWIKRVYQGVYHDFKTELQNFLQTHQRLLPIYRILRTNGPDHAKKFEVGVFIKGEMWGKGIANSRKKAEQIAAKEALERLKR